MKFEIVIFMVVFPGYLQAGSGESNRKSFNEAVEDCNNQGLELLTLSTYRQYLDVKQYLNAYSVDDSWLALEKNTTTGNYQWLNGRVLTELRWGTGEPRNYTVADCGVMNVSSRLWYTLPCTDSRYYLCVGSDGYSVGSISVDFYTAVLNCQSEGRRLPVAITNLDTKWLNNVITNAGIYGDIWLGLIEYGTQYGDYYRWVTGEHLTPPYHWWTNSGRYARVHYHHGGGEGFHISSASQREFICMPKSTETAAVGRSLDKFMLVSYTAVVLNSIRKTTTINTLRRFQCALKCLQDTGCIQYTIQGYLCRTFGESLVITDNSRGHMLWQKKVIS
ncbi:hypothetical protein LOTGIDRAFT_169340 [Lottia gigantea]|uniref:C-type lectin domain-containing protein n=1 Tax=Lottia gigantea TaxID=225164 RepID=V3YYT9_LOTGI|nr:hypothetical protein LOTGIDRAFT_169340 [Lottia gigantea]ESO83318.1 hypothetical protein LOTGIDRAFT_169340 [Lottia gigantea]